MSQIPSNYQCQCKSCSTSKYHTRSVAKSCTNQISAQEQHAGVQASSQLGSRQSSHPTSGRKEHLVSRLLQSIIRYWIFMTLDQQVLRSQSQAGDIPSSPATTLSNDNTSDGGSTTSLSKHDRSSDIEEESVDGSVNEGASMSQTDPASNEDADLTKFTLKSLLLGEELKRLQVWKTSFSNDELDRLPTIDHEVAQSVLKCLTNVANILIEGSKEWRIRSEPDDLKTEGVFLESLLEEIETKASESNVENEAMTDCSGISESDESYLTIGNPSLIKDLKYEIDRLQMLSHSLRLGMRTGVIFTNS
ncbi:hypothetical protein FOCG_08418 [Fusarium oxysporum f. sp. radicis-lycopersici 26381]|nr:hypothetical protein FOWG_15214 [Fusarium oxysporum f. sp. lycopersici MN25]EXL52632.1 hypothetical protein FOCG_08418 [Fusarium oxysporum f. sp. radicis-lycopersici 26381]KAJ0138401.1 hypothetical protein HZ326_18639 [Fusarium oxysporum f. sp. albedinis]